MQGGERVAAGGVRQRRGKGCAVGKRVGEQTVIAGASDLDPAKAREMRRQELGVEEAVAAEPQPGRQMHEGDFARVGGTAEHAFAKKDGAERYAV
jgi:hypothetical protein